jgi:hypothetical protein
MNSSDVMISALFFGSLFFISGIGTSMLGIVAFRPTARIASRRSVELHRAQISLPTTQTVAIASSTVSESTESPNSSTVHHPQSQVCSKDGPLFSFSNTTTPRFTDRRLIEQHRRAVGDTASGWSVSARWIQDATRRDNSIRSTEFRENPTIAWSRQACLCLRLRSCGPSSLGLGIRSLCSRVIDLPGAARVWRQRRLDIALVANPVLWRGRTPETPTRVVRTIARGRFLTRGR